MSKLMLLELRKLKRKNFISEITTYYVIMAVLPIFFIKVVHPIFGESYDMAIELINLSTQMAYITFAASLINQVIIEEYKNKTITLGFSYPINRQKLFIAKILFIAAMMFVVQMVSFIISGVITFSADAAFGIIKGSPTAEQIYVYFIHAIFYSAATILVGLIPMFYFGIIRRATVTTVIFGIIIMQVLNFTYILQWNEELVLSVLCLLGAVNIFLSVKMIDRVGEAL
ncbi:ABC-2 family transporter [Bacillus oleivorans]|uniref:ABC-2 family transporter n=1 Tax=Bacillus oleivorans TaxID=1448271 RepID=A0A285CT72_9BACI|nr:ABC transporter permease [Bacillus oleivorans]SNX70779.1 ABC-2 family transporter [Bacillus oleivorans]